VGLNFGEAVKYLMINADDFGMCHAMNEAIIGLLEDDLITSATLMPPCPWFAEAVTYAKEHPEKCIGLHLTLTSEWEQYRWGSLTRNKSLMVNGYFPKSSLEIEQNALPSEVEEELRAQLALTKAYGLIPSHLDNHMGSLYGFHGIQSFLPLAFQLCGELKVPFRFPKKILSGDAVTDPLPNEVLAKLPDLAALAKTLGVSLPDYIVSYPFETLPGETYENFRDDVCKRIGVLPEGVSELILHPAFESAEIKAINPHWQKRVWEERLCRDAKFIETIERLEFKRITWRDLPQLAL
jgi:chitin disaccharide deacetylase